LSKRKGSTAGSSLAEGCGDATGLSSWVTGVLKGLSKGLTVGSGPHAQEEQAMVNQAATKINAADLNPMFLSYSRVEPPPSGGGSLASHSSEELRKVEALVVVVVQLHRSSWQSHLVRNGDNRLIALNYHGAVSAI